jgi:P27 family predicted phage terminase small subunit
VKGRKPKPPALRLVTGNPGKRPIKATPRPQGQAARPGGLSPGAAAEWRRLAPRLTALGLLTPADRAFFAAYCEAVATWREANDKLREHGAVVLDRNSRVIKNPWLRVRADAAAELRQFGAEFGLSPVGRARLDDQAPGGGGRSNNDPAARYFT